MDVFQFNHSPFDKLRDHWWEGIMEMRKFLVTLITLIAGFNPLYGSDVIHPSIEDKEEVLIVLGGWSGSRENMENVVTQLSKDAPMKVIELNYCSYKGFDTCISNLKDQIKNAHLENYSRAHFFCFIMGGYILKKYLETESIPNIGNVILDRSPYQEAISSVAQEVISPEFVKLTGGQSALDLATLDFDTFPIPSEKIGVIVEEKPGIMARALNFIAAGEKIRKEPISFNKETILKKRSDCIYLHATHPDMYHHTENYQSDLWSFVKYGCFTAEARREPTNVTVVYYQ